MHPYGVPPPGGPPPGGPPPHRPGAPPQGQYYGQAPPRGPPGMLPPRPGLMPPGPGMPGPPPGMAPPPIMSAPYPQHPVPSSFQQPARMPAGLPPPLASPMPGPPPRALPKPGPLARPKSSLPPPTLAAPKAGDGGRPKQSAVKSTNLVVSKIPASLDQDTLQALFKACGPIKSWKQPSDSETGKPKLFGFLEYENAESVVVALRVLHKLAVDDLELMLKATNSTSEYIAWWQAHRDADAREATEDGEEGETDDQREMRVMEVVMDITSKRKTPDASTAAVDDLIGSVRKEGSKGMRNREGRLENEFEQDRQRMDREERQRAKDDEREYQRRLKEVERYEEKLMQQRRKRRRQEDDDIRERQALIKQDNEQSDTEAEEDRWKRTPWRFTQAALVRKAARTREEAEDEDDRMKELEEAALRTHNGNAGSVEASNGRTETAAAQTTYPAPPSVKKEVALDPNDGIMKAMMAEVQAKQEDNSAGGWQNMDSTPAPAAKTAPKEESKEKENTKKMYFTDEDRRQPARAPPGGAAAADGGAPAPAPRRRAAQDIVSIVPTTHDGVWAYPVKWDFLRLDDQSVRERHRTKLAKQVMDIMGPEGDLLADELMDLLLKRSGPAAIVKHVDFFGEREAQDFTFKLFRALIAESEINAANV